MSPSSPPGSGRLVLGDDGAPPSDRAWRWILNHPWPEWQVDVMTADTEQSHIDWGEPPAASEWTPGWDRSQLPPEVEGIRFLKMVADPRAMLADVAADLVVLGMGTDGYWEALITGSTTEWLLHHPPAPLAVIRDPAPVQSVTVCVDGSRHATHALECFAALPLAISTDVTVLAVADGRTDAESTADAARAALVERVATVTTVVETGPPTPTILDHLETSRPHLVVLGTRGLTGWDRLRLGSTAASVVRAAPCNGLVASDESPPQ